MTPSSSMLHEHGTGAFALPAGAILCAARHDVRLRQRKLANGAAQATRYNFHRTHVLRAGSDVSTLLSLAIADRERGIASGKLETRRIYRHEDGLRGALDLAIQEQGARL
jgi:hypothetical protein